MSLIICKLSTSCLKSSPILKMTWIGAPRGSLCLHSTTSNLRRHSLPVLEFEPERFLLGGHVDAFVHEQAANFQSGEGQGSQPKWAARNSPRIQRKSKLGWKLNLAEFRSHDFQLVAEESRSTEGNKEKDEYLVASLVIFPTA